MSLTLGEIAAQVRRVIPCELRGDADLLIDRAAHPRSTPLEGALVPCFSSTALAAAAAGGATAVLAPPGMDLPPGVPGGLIAERPRAALGLALTALQRPLPASEATDRPDRIDPTARIARDALVDPTALIDAFAVVGRSASVGPAARLGPGVVLGDGAVVGAGCVLDAGVVIGGGCRLGARVRVQANAVIGSAGFSYDTAGPSNVDAARGDETEATVQPWIRIPSMGIVVLGDDVEVGAGACIDRPTLGVSHIGAGTKIDNLVQVAHHVEIGEHCLLAAQVGLAGSCVIEDGAVLGGQVGVVDHQRIGRLAVVLAGADVHSDIAPGAVVAGAPARPRREWFRRLAAAGRLDGVRHRLRSIEERLAALEREG